MKSKNRHFTINRGALIGIVLFIGIQLKANNAVISQVFVTGNLINFSLTWENSWRTSTSNPFNYDGVWLYCNYRVCNDRPEENPNAPSYKQLWLSPQPQDHSVPGAEFQLGSSLIGGNSRVMGIFIFRPTDGSGTFTVNNIELKWDDVAQGCTGCEVDVQIIPVEMVNIPTGNYSLGDGNNGSSGRFYRDNNLDSPFLVTSESGININTSNGIYAPPSVLFDSGMIPNAFPKGYNSFWCMKYEVSQLQYVEFLNSLSRSDQALHVSTDISIGVTHVNNTFVLSNTNSPLYRNGIRITPDFNSNMPLEFYCDLDGDNIPNEDTDGKNIAVNFINSDDFKAYLDWTGLRPMSELEFEKICRGDRPPIPKEYSWGLGGINFMPKTSIQDAGLAYEDALPNGAGSVTCCNQAGVQGPLRSGENFALNSDRFSAGAAYYGIADMSGNLIEFCIPVSKAECRVFDASHGDGDISNGPPSTWILLDVPGTLRGGSWKSAADKLSVSHRDTYGLPHLVRSSEFGIRGVRTN